MKYSMADLEKILQECQWEKIDEHLWEKGRSRLWVDWVGIFFYRFQDQQWFRVAGLAHNRLRHLSDRLIIFCDDSRLNLLTGE
jgi:hypothetical protein